MTAARVRYSKIKQLTLRVLEGHGTSAPAVPIEEIIRSYDVEIRSGDLGQVSGLIARSGSGTIIGVNRTHSRVRQRFTLAHEFGHFLLHQDLESHADTDFRVKYRDRKSSEATDVEEIEANFFAASVLMPVAFLDAERAFEALGDDALVVDLAQRFNVSAHAMSLRLANEYASHRPF